MSKKILILGANGMLGADLAKVFKSYNPVCWTRKDLDITDKKAVADKIAFLSPDIVINAAGYTAVDDAEKNMELANNVNGYAAGYIANACHLAGATFVHYSTDYVFDGENKMGYKEDDEACPVNAYGASKYLGEQLILLRESQSFIKCPSFANCPKAQEGGRCGERKGMSKFKYYLIRTSWLYGAAGKNFVDTMLNLAQNNNKLRVVNDQHGKPTYTADLAQRTLELVKSNAPYGVYHITNETLSDDGVSWYDFARKIFEIKAGIDKNFVVPAVEAVTTNEFPRPAKRPRYSMLVNTKMPLSRRWEEALEEYLKIKPKRKTTMQNLKINLI